MSSKSPKKALKKPSTAGAQTTTYAVRTSFADQFFEQRQNADLQIDLQNTRLAEEHLQTLLVNMNQKLLIQNDLKMDVQEYQKMKLESE